MLYETCNKFESHIKGENFIWLCEYNDGSNLPEFPFEESTKRNLFKDIEKDKLSRFGIMGLGQYISFDVNDGIFNIENKKIEVIIQDDLSGKTYRFANNGQRYDDLIMYREGTAIANVGQYISAYCVGWKSTIDGVSVKEIFRVSVEDEPQFLYWFVFDKDIKGKLIVNITDSTNKYIREYEAEFKAGVGREFRWIIK